MGDAALIRRALKERWPISAANKIKAVETLTTLLNNPMVEPAEKLRAIKILGELDSLNVRREQIEEMSKPKHVVITDLPTEELLARIKEKFSELGVSPTELPLLEGDFMSHDIE